MGEGSSKGSGLNGNYLWMNLGWYRNPQADELAIDQGLAGVYFVANG
jgi:hypothetical protein